MGKVRKTILVLVVAACMFAVCAKPVYGAVPNQGIHFFYSQECGVCFEVLDSLERSLGPDDGFEIQTYEIGQDSHNLNLLFYLLDQYQKEDFEFRIPIVFVGHTVLAGAQDISRGLDQALEEARSLEEDPAGALIDAYQDQDSQAMAAYITLPAVVVSALIDSTNPCAIAVMLFLISTLMLNKDKRKVLLYGAIYIGTIFLVYLGLGVGYVYFMDTLTIPPVVFVSLGAVLAIAGLLSIKDFFWYGKGPSLGIPAPVKTAIENNIQKATILSMLTMGILVSIFEATCSGAIYIGVLSLIAEGGFTPSLGAKLLLYNVLFIAPLLVILGVFYWGLPLKKIQRFLIQKKRKTYRLIAGIILLFLGIYLIVSNFNRL